MTTHLRWRSKVNLRSLGRNDSTHDQITAALGVLTAVVLYRVLNNKRLSSIKIYRTILFSSAFCVSIAGHFGASLTHGDDYLSSALPWTDDYNPPSSNNFSATLAGNDSLRLSATQQQQLSIEVQAIFAHNCYKCHSSKKVKGELRLDQKHMALKGGEDGPVIIPGKP